MAKPSQEYLDGIMVLKIRSQVSRSEYLEAMWIMDYNYPGHGWGEEAKKLEAFYQELEDREKREREALAAQDPLAALMAEVLPDLETEK